MDIQAILDGIELLPEEKIVSKTDSQFLSLIHI